MPVPVGDAAASAALAAAAAATPAHPYPLPTPLSLAVGHLLTATHSYATLYSSFTAAVATGGAQLVSTAADWAALMVTDRARASLRTCAASLEDELLSVLRTRLTAQAQLQKFASQHRQVGERLKLTVREYRQVRKDTEALRHRFDVASAATDSLDAALKLRRTTRNLAADLRAATDRLEQATRQATMWARELAAVERQTEECTALVQLLQNLDAQRRHRDAVLGGADQAASAAAAIAAAAAAASAASDSSVPGGSNLMTRGRAPSTGALRAFNAPLASSPLHIAGFPSLPPLFPPYLDELPSLEQARAVLAALPAQRAGIAHRAAAASKTVSVLTTTVSALRQDPEAAAARLTYLQHKLLPEAGAKLSECGARLRWLHRGVERESWLLSDTAQRRRGLLTVMGSIATRVALMARLHQSAALAAGARNELKVVVIRRLQTASVAARAACERAALLWKKTREAAVVLWDAVAAVYNEAAAEAEASAVAAAAGGGAGVNSTAASGGRLGAKGSPPAGGGGGEWARGAAVRAWLLTSVAAAPGALFAPYSGGRLLTSTELAARFAPHFPSAKTLSGALPAAALAAHNAPAPAGTASSPTSPPPGAGLGSAWTPSSARPPAEVDTAALALAALSHLARHRDALGRPLLPLPVQTLTAAPSSAAGGVGVTVAAHGRMSVPSTTAAGGAGGGTGCESVDVLSVPLLSHAISPGAPEEALLAAAAPGVFSSPDTSAAAARAGRAPGALTLPPLLSSASPCAFPLPLPLPVSLQARALAHYATAQMWLFKRHDVSTLHVNMPPPDLAVSADASVPPAAAAAAAALLAGVSVGVPAATVRSAAGAAAPAPAGGAYSVTAATVLTPHTFTVMGEDLRVTLIPRGAAEAAAAAEEAEGTMIAAPTPGKEVGARGRKRLSRNASFSRSRTASVSIVASAAAAMAAADAAADGGFVAPALPAQVHAMGLAQGLTPAHSHVPRGQSPLAGAAAAPDGVAAPSLSPAPGVARSLSVYRTPPTGLPGSAPGYGIAAGGAGAAGGSSAAPPGLARLSSRLMLSSDVDGSGLGGAAPAVVSTLLDALTITPGIGGRGDVHEDRNIHHHGPPTAATAAAAVATAAAAVRRSGSDASDSGARGSDGSSGEDDDDNDGCDVVTAVSPRNKHTLMFKQQQMLSSSSPLVHHLESVPEGADLTFAPLPPPDFSGSASGALSLVPAVSGRPSPELPALPSPDPAAPLIAPPFGVSAGPSIGAGAGAGAGALVRGRVSRSGSNATADSGGFEFLTFDRRRRGGRHSGRGSRRGSQSLYEPSEQQRRRRRGRARGASGGVGGAAPAEPDYSAAPSGAFGGQSALPLPPLRTPPLPRYAHACPPSLTPLAPPVLTVALHDIVAVEWVEDPVYVRADGTQCTCFTEFVVLPTGAVARRQRLDRSWDPMRFIAAIEATGPPPPPLPLRPDAVGSAGYTKAVAACAPVAATAAVESAFDIPADARLPPGDARMPVPHAPRAIPARLPVPVVSAPAPAVDVPVEAIVDAGGEQQRSLFGGGPGLGAAGAPTLPTGAPAPAHAPVPLALPPVSVSGGFLAPPPTADAAAAAGARAGGAHNPYATPLAGPLAASDWPVGLSPLMGHTPAPAVPNADSGALPALALISTSSGQPAIGYHPDAAAALTAPLTAAAAPPAPTTARSSPPAPTAAELAASLPGVISRHRGQALSAFVCSLPVIAAADALPEGAVVVSMCEGASCGRLPFCAATANLPLLRAGGVVAPEATGAVNTPASAVGALAANPHLPGTGVIALQSQLAAPAAAAGAAGTAGATGPQQRLELATASVSVLRAIQAVDDALLLSNSNTPGGDGARGAVAGAGAKSTFPTPGPAMASSHPGFAAVSDAEAGTPSLGYLLSSSADTAGCALSRRARLFVHLRPGYANITERLATVTGGAVLATGAAAARRRRRHTAGGGGALADGVAPELAAELAAPLQPGLRAALGDGIRDRHLRRWRLWREEFGDGFGDGFGTRAGTGTGYYDGSDSGSSTDGGSGSDDGSDVDTADDTITDASDADGDVDGSGIRVRLHRRGGRSTTGGAGAVALAGDEDAHVLELYGDLRSVHYLFSSLKAALSHALLSPQSLTPVPLVTDYGVRAVVSAAPLWSRSGSSSGPAAWCDFTSRDGIGRLLTGGSRISPHPLSDPLGCPLPRLGSHLTAAAAAGAAHGRFTAHELLELHAGAGRHAVSPAGEALFAPAAAGAGAGELGQTLLPAMALFLPPASAPGTAGADGAGARSHGVPQQQQPPLPLPPMVSPLAWAYDGLCPAPLADAFAAAGAATATVPSSGSAGGVAPEPLTVAGVPVYWTPASAPAASPPASGHGHDHDHGKLQPPGTVSTPTGSAAAGATGTGAVTVLLPTLLPPNSAPGSAMAAAAPAAYAGAHPASAAAATVGPFAAALAAHSLPPAAVRALAWGRSAAAYAAVATPAALATAGAAAPPVAPALPLGAHPLRALVALLAAAYSTEAGAHTVEAGDAYPSIPDSVVFTTPVIALAPAALPASASSPGACSGLRGGGDAAFADAIARAAFTAAPAESPTRNGGGPNAGADAVARALAAALCRFIRLPTPGAGVTAVASKPAASPRGRRNTGAAATVAAAAAPLPPPPPFALDLSVGVASAGISSAALIASIAPVLHKLYAGATAVPGAGSSADVNADADMVAYAALSTGDCARLAAAYAAAVASPAAILAPLGFLSAPSKREARALPSDGGSDLTALAARYLPLPRPLTHPLSVAARALALAPAVLLLLALPASAAVAPAMASSASNSSSGYPRGHRRLSFIRSLAGASGGTLFAAGNGHAEDLAEGWWSTAAFGTGARMLTGTLPLDGSDGVAVAAAAGGKPGAVAAAPQIIAPTGPVAAGAPAPSLEVDSLLCAVLGALRVAHAPALTATVLAPPDLQGQGPRASLLGLLQQQPQPQLGSQSSDASAAHVSASGYLHLLRAAATLNPSPAASVAARALTLSLHGSVAVPLLWLPRAHVPPGSGACGVGAGCSLVKLTPHCVPVSVARILARADAAAAGSTGVGGVTRAGIGINAAAAAAAAHATRVAAAGSAAAMAAHARGPIAPASAALAAAAASAAAFHGVAALLRCVQPLAGAAAAAASAATAAPTSAAGASAAASPAFLPLRPGVLTVTNGVALMGLGGLGWGAAAAALNAEAVRALASGGGGDGASDVTVGPSAGSGSAAAWTVPEEERVPIIRPSGSLALVVGIRPSAPTSPAPAANAKHAGGHSHQHQQGPSHSGEVVSFVTGALMGGHAASRRTGTVVTAAPAASASAAASTAGGATLVLTVTSQANRLVSPMAMSVGMAHQRARALEVETRGRALRRQQAERRRLVNRQLLQARAPADTAASPTSPVSPAAGTSSQSQSQSQSQAQAQAQKQSQAPATPQKGAAKPAPTPSKAGKTGKDKDADKAAAAAVAAAAVPAAAAAVAPVADAASDAAPAPLKRVDTMTAAAAAAAKRYHSKQLAARGGGGGRGGNDDDDDDDDAAGAGGDRDGPARENDHVFRGVVRSNAHVALRGASKIVPADALKLLIRQTPKSARVRPWGLVFDTATHGASLAKFYEHAATKAPDATIIVARDHAGRVFGGFCPKKWIRGGGAVGNGECFVYLFDPDLVLFRWSGETRYYANAGFAGLSFGGGGDEALYFDANLTDGKSGRSKTYNNECLSTEGLFKVSAFELWAQVPLV
jgi:hypothetical protein